MDTGSDVLFRSLFSWITLLGGNHGVAADYYEEVSILVFVDHAPRGDEASASQLPRLQVSILVFVDHAPRGAAEGGS